MTPELSSVRRRRRIFALCGVLSVLTVLAMIFAYRAGQATVYRDGYHAGLRAVAPNYRYLMRIKRSSDNPDDSSTTTVGLYDLNLRADADALREKVEELKSEGADYYVTTATVENTIMPDPRPQDANSQR